MEKAYSIQDQLFRYVKDNTYKDVSNLSADTQLFVEGIFDSMGFVLLLDFLEQDLGLEIGDEEIIEENFESIQAITDLVMRKSTAAA